jgi:hypothetical protein
MDIARRTFLDQGPDQWKIIFALFDDERRKKSTRSRWEGNSDFASRYAHVRADIAFHCIQFFYQVLRAMRKYRTRFRQSNTPAVPLQEFDTELVLQALHAFAQRRLSDAELDGRFRKTSQFGDDDKGIEIFEVHHWSSIALRYSVRSGGRGGNCLPRLRGLGARINWFTEVYEEKQQLQVQRTTGSVFGHDQQAYLNWR